jgi:hypothetical protein
MFNKIINRMNKHKRTFEQYQDKQSKKYDWGNTYKKTIKIKDEINELKVSGTNE